MEIDSTREFEKDIKKLGGKDRKRLDEIIILLSSGTLLGKRLHHLKNVYSVRMENRRLIYQVVEKQNKIILMMFKSREDVYGYLMD